MSSTTQIFLLAQPGGEPVEGLLHERINGEYAKVADYLWLSHLGALQGRAEARGVPFERPDNFNWRWHVKVSESAHLLSCPTFAVEHCGEAQGLMLLKTDGHFGLLAGQERKPLVYIQYLATAPWNSREVTDNPRFLGVGTVLLRAAIATSIDAEFKGRIGLHSLPKAEQFYERHGFKCLGADPHKENLQYYELSQEAAAEFMR